MTNRWQLLTTLYLLVAVLPGGCAKQSTGDTGNAGGNGVTSPTSSIFSGGSGNGTGSNGTGLNGAITGPTAESTVDGTQGIPATEAKRILNDANAACQGWTVEAEAEPVILEFVIDVSGSMNQATPSTGGRTKWDVTREALKSTVDSLPASFGVGITFYPNMGVTPGTTPRPTSACVDTANDIPIAMATADQLANIQASIDAIQINTTGATPTHDAYNIALDQMRNTALTGKKYIVVITDGQPTQAQGCIGNGSTCNPQPTAPIIEAIAQAKANDDVNTFIVGSPGSELNACTGDDIRGWLSQAATAGNTPSDICSDAGPNFCHFDLSTATDFGAALKTALFTITNSLLLCNYTVPPAPAGKQIQPGLVNMIYSDGSDGFFLILPSASATCDKGWTYTDTSMSEVRICGASCELFQNNPKAKLSILFGCTQNQIPIQ